jgi:hypothetical protein
MGTAGDDTAGGAFTGAALVVFVIGVAGVVDALDGRGAG